MREDKFEQVVKESLESMNPDVPAHLWDNIRANIPSASPAEAGTGAGQGAAGSTGAGASGLIKLGAAAVVLIGGGILVWQLNTGEVNIASNNSNEIAEQAEPVAPMIPEHKTSEQRVDAVENQSIERNASTDVDRVDGQVQENTISTPQNQDPKGELPIENEAEESGPAQNASGIAEANSDEQPTDVQNQASESASDNLKAGDSNEKASTPQVEEQNTAKTPSVAVPNPVPLQVVEVGILADEVFGEAPLSIQFSNVTNAQRYEWDFGNGRKSNEASPMPTFDRPGEYTVKLTVTDFDGNRLSDEMEISVVEPSVIYLPDVFTPNGDGLNDFFEVKGTNITGVTFEIFRLDGSMVYTGTDIHDKWDGNDRQQPGNRQYMVVIRYVKNDGTPAIEKSMLTVIRD